ncbi:hypothetical protein OSB04_021941 [Centaurea solstitialis]|uniref:Uncharacterized protein n=1 Tax=Centaurea solstitialis TaxID=347529 RepID=A0AA38TEY7_9ASTR|nr:hypothetical protein OSB04_021941 [Centaurea solstitialis]
MEKLEQREKKHEDLEDRYNIQNSNLQEELHHAKEAAYEKQLVKLVKEAFETLNIELETKKRRMHNLEHGISEREAQKSEEFEASKKSEVLELRQKCTSQEAQISELTRALNLTKISESQIKEDLLGKESQLKELKLKLHGLEKQSELLELKAKETESELKQFSSKIGSNGGTFGTRFKFILRVAFVSIIVEFVPKVNQKVKLKTVFKVTLKQTLKQISSLGTHFSYCLDGMKTLWTRNLHAT